MMYVAQNQELAYRIIDDEAVILTPEDGKPHNLNPVATRIFELADGNRDISEIVRYIVEEFEVKEDIAKKDIMDFIGEMVNKKILILSDRPIKNEI